MPWKKSGINLRTEEMEQLDQLAKKLNVSRNSLVRFAINHLLELVKNKDLDLKQHIKRGRNSLEMPS